jgi:methionyl-tRNA formyltransferase
MRVLLFSGSHARHVYVHQKLVESDALDVTGIVSMDREPTVPDPPPDWPAHDSELFEHHFNRREEVERDVYGDRSPDWYSSVAPTKYVQPDKLNSEHVAEFVRDADAEAAFIFGTGIIRSPVYDVLPEWRLNFHLGLSPWYRGSATLFWPFYFLQPQFAGGTLHQIVDEPDAGAIVHHSRPELKRGNGIHETAADVTVNFAEETTLLFEQLAEHGTLPTNEQTSSGKLFLKRDFEPHHLRVVYDLYDNDIVDRYLDGELGDRKPALFDALNKLGLYPEK